MACRLEYTTYRRMEAARRLRRAVSRKELNCPLRAQSSTGILVLLVAVVGDGGISAEG